MSQSINRLFTADESTGAREWESIINRMIGRACTVTVVRVGAVEAGGTGPVGFLTATDLVQQVDGNGQGLPNAPLQRLPYFRLQGGSNAVVIDPKVGDIGIAVFAQRDISHAKRSKQEAPPPSLRTHDQSDGIYIGGILNGAPAQWLHFLDSGVHIKSTGQVTIDGTLLQVNCPIKATGDITDNAASQSQSMSSMRSTYNSHTHPGDSGGTTGTPNQDM